MKRVFYLFVLSVLFCAFYGSAQKLLPLSVQQFLDERAWSGSAGMCQYSQYASPRVIDGVEMIDAFIAIDDESTLTALQQFGVRVNCVFDGFVTAQIPVDQLSRVSTMPGVNDVEISARAQLCTDSTMSVTHAGQLIYGTQNSLPRNFDGTGVVVGIIDKGFDFQHRAFKYNDNVNRSRIVRVYHTENNTGHPVYYKTSKLPGSVFMGAQIDTLTTDDRGGTHGTHTSSIAAGSHVNGYGGMAPGADIVLCAVSRTDGGLSVVEMANCARYITSYADSVRKPCVMSLSISIPGGQHDGNDYLSKAIAQVTGPGHIFVIAAGNGAGGKQYAHKQFTMDNPMNLLFNCNMSDDADLTYNYRTYLASVWMRNSWRRFNFKIHILDKNTNTIVWESDMYDDGMQLDASSFSSYYNYNPEVDTNAYIKVTRRTSSDGKKSELYVYIRNLICQDYTVINGVKHSRYAIGMSFWPQTDIVCDADVWTGNSYSSIGDYDNPVTGFDGSYTPSGFYTHGSDSCSIGTYAVNDSVISAGAYVARNSYYSYYWGKTITDNSVTIGDIAPFSSYQAAGYGPTGKALPTICAPGYTVVAAGSRYSYFASTHISTVMKTDDGSCWGVMTGTSMSSPTVAGIIALWLQLNPKLSVRHIKEILAQTAIRDNFTTGSKAAQFGPNGKIDALAGMRLIMNEMGYICGDVNGDGHITISDVTAMIDYLLSGSSVINTANSDVDGDGKISIVDVTALIDILLTGA